MDVFGISVIICTHNGAKRIVSALEALARQQVPMDLPWEIIVVDNGSTDNTSGIVTAFRETVNPGIPFRLLHEFSVGKANALVKGYNEAKYELMLLCDDDNILHPEYLKTAAEIYRLHPEIGLLGGYGIAEFRNETKPAWFDKYENYYVCGKHHTLNGPLQFWTFSIWGAGSVLRKSLWNYLCKCGFQFFNSRHPGKAIGEDAELAVMIMFSGMKLWFDDGLWFRHDLSGGRLTWMNFIAQRRLTGKSCACLPIYRLAFRDRKNKDSAFSKTFSVHLIKSSYRIFFSLLDGQDLGWIIFTFYRQIELILHPRKYRKLYYSSKKWIIRISEGMQTNELKPSGDIQEKAQTAGALV